MGTHYEAVAADGLRRKVVNVLLGAYNGKLNAESEDDSCTIAAQAPDAVVRIRGVS